jgi:hypothetical protein
MANKQIPLDLKETGVYHFAQEIILAIERFDARIKHDKYSITCPLCCGRNSLHCSDCDGSGMVLDEAQLADDRLLFVVDRINELLEGEK